MSIVPIHDMEKLRPLFQNAAEAAVLSCLDGSMGSAYGDDPASPRSAVILSGGYSYFGGVPSGALVAFLPRIYREDVVTMVPGNAAWAQMIEATLGERAKRTTRYATKKDGSAFDRERLSALAGAADPAFAVVPIDRDLYDLLRKERWSAHFVENFRDCGDYLARGVGFAALYGGQPVAGASSYTVSSRGIEVTIATKPEFRRHGLALALSARLVLACLERGLYPDWDARIPASLAISEKLGYRFDRAYPAYEMTLPPDRARIRPMAEGDWPGVQRIFAQGIADGNATFRTVCPDYPEWDGEHLPFCRLVAEERGEILGFAVLTPKSARVCYSGVAEVSVYIAKGARGQGVGEALLQELIRDAEQAGIWTLYSVIFADNAGSVQLHKACGFRHVGRQERLAKDKFGAWRDTVIYERRSNLVGED